MAAGRQELEGNTDLVLHSMRSSHAAPASFPPPLLPRPRGCRIASPTLSRAV